MKVVWVLVLWVGLCVPPPATAHSILSRHESAKHSDRLLAGDDLGQATVRHKLQKRQEMQNHRLVGDFLRLLSLVSNQHKPSTNNTSLLDLEVTGALGASPDESQLLGLIFNQFTDGCVGDACTATLDQFSPMYRVLSAIPSLELLVAPVTQFQDFIISFAKPTHQATLKQLREVLTTHLKAVDKLQNTEVADNMLDHLAYVWLPGDSGDAKDDSVITPCSFVREVLLENGLMDELVINRAKSLWPSDAESLSLAQFKGTLPEDLNGENVARALFEIFNIDEWATTRFAFRAKKDSTGCTDAPPARPNVEELTLSKCEFAIAIAGTRGARQIANTANLFRAFSFLEKSRVQAGNQLSFSSFVALAKGVDVARRVYNPIMARYQLSRLIPQDAKISASKEAYYFNLFSTIAGLPEKPTHAGKCITPHQIKSFLTQSLVKHRPEDADCQVAARMKSLLATHLSRTMTGVSDSSVVSCEPGQMSWEDFRGAMAVPAPLYVGLSSQDVEEFENSFPLAAGSTQQVDENRFLLLLQSAEWIRRNSRDCVTITGIEVTVNVDECNGVGSIPLATLRQNSLFQKTSLEDFQLATPGRLASIAFVISRLQPPIMSPTTYEFVEAAPASVFFCGDQSTTGFADGEYKLLAATAPAVFSSPELDSYKSLVANADTIFKRDGTFGSPTSYLVRVNSGHTWLLLQGSTNGNELAPAYRLIGRGEQSPPANRKFDSYVKTFAPPGLKSVCRAGHESEPQSSCPIIRASRCIQANTIELRSGTATGSEEVQYTSSEFVPFVVGSTSVAPLVQSSTGGAAKVAMMFRLHLVGITGDSDVLKFAVLYGAPMATADKLIWESDNASPDSAFRVEVRVTKEEGQSAQTRLVSVLVSSTTAGTGDYSLLLKAPHQHWHLLHTVRVLQHKHAQLPK